MKKLLLAILMIVCLTGYTQNKNTQTPDTNDRNNNFYDNEVVYPLTLPVIEIAGEIENPGIVDFSSLTKRTIIVKETRLNADGSEKFIGAYRYDGYSLFDILNNRIITKKNVEKFNPIIDLYIEIENDKGERALFSWGEIYYPNVLHNIIIASDVMRIVPSKTKDLWPLPETSKVVVGADLLTERNISNPVKITVRSFEEDIAVNRDITPLYSDKFNFVTKNYSSKSNMKDTKIYGKSLFDLKRLEDYNQETLHTIFYGRGRGIHSTSAFRGYLLKEVLNGQTEFNAESLRTSLITLCGIDGYRAVYTYSEIMNRNDQAEVLLLPAKEEQDGGAWKIFPSCDFFSDRAVKALTDIYYTIH